MSKEHDHDHSHGHECCGHDHAHSHKHEHEHEHEHEHKHDHSHEGCDHHHSHEHKHECCGHDHSDAEWTRRFFAFLQGVVLLMIGGVMVYFVISGRIDGRNPNAPYVTGWFRVLALAGGLGLMVLGLFNWITGRRAVDCGHDHDDSHGHTHDHDRAHSSEEETAASRIHSHDGSATGRALTLLVLSGSIAAAAIYTPDGFSGKYSINKGYAYAGDANSAEKLLRTSPEVAKVAAAPGAFTLAKVEEYIKRTPEGNFPLSVVNLHYMGADAEYAAVMDAQPVETVGQVVKDELNPGPKNYRIFVMQVTCCAADARPYSVPFTFENAVPDIVEMGWYKAKGKLEFIQERGMKIARLHLAKPEDLQATIRPDPEKPGY